MKSNNWWLLKHIALIFIFGSAIIIYVFKSISVKTQDTNLSQNYFVTSKGKIHLDEIVANVFEKYGFKLVKNDIIPILKKTIPMNCYEMFSESKKVANSDLKASDAPKELMNPEAFLLNNYSTLSKYYFNQIPKNDETSLPVWKEEFINDYVNRVKVDPHGIAAYPNESVSVYMATKYFNINGKVGAVIGSLSPWVESYLLANGAKNVTTIEYQKIKILHPQMNFLYAPQLLSLLKIYDNHFDFAVSFSSIEHSGLGRYGDPLDPIGDIREMNKVRCLLKSGGLFFFGVPVGQDSIAYNAHRIYGRMRLAMMFEGFEILQIFYNDAKNPINVTQSMLESGFRQFLFVLQKNE